MVLHGNNAIFILCFVPSLDGKLNMYAFRNEEERGSGKGKMWGGEGKSGIERLMER